MKIVFDHQIFSLQKQGGISRYIFYLCENLKNLGNDAIIRVQWSENVYLKNKKSLPSWLPWRIRQLSYLLLNQISDYIFPLENIDILHATYYGSSPLKKHARKTAVTIFDMIHELKLIKPSFFDKTTAGKLNALASNDIVFTISNSTKKEIQKYYPKVAKEVEVTYLGTEIAKHAKTMRKKIMKENYILYVGNRQGYKNFIPYVTAIASVLKTMSMQLVAFGGGSFTKNENETLSDLGLTKLVMQISGNDDLLAVYYENAIFLAYPSLSEGFGLPIVEAFALGCPVLTSNCSSMKEIAKDNALLFDPNSQSSMRLATHKFLTDQTLRLQLAESGRSRSKLFTWINTARQTCKLYQDSLRLIS